MSHLNVKSFLHGMMTAGDITGFNQHKSQNRHCPEHHGRVSTSQDKTR